ncbi:MAG: hypothetical protein M3O88_00785, partial [Actinomycetota bacterium]|nr:hypothetical protein [Actinomycetota bacterium]
VAPTTTISPTPGSPDGHNGSYASSVHLGVSAVDDDGGSGVVETRCVVDPGSAPATFADMPSACPLASGGIDVSGPGSHVAYAASEDAAGNDELPVLFSFRIGHTLSVTVNDASSGGSSVTSSRGPIDCPGTCSADLSEGDVTLTASPGPGLAFAGWSGDCAGNGGCVLAMTQDSSVTARFVAPDASAPTTSIALSPASPDGHDGSYASSAHVTVSAADEPGGSGVAATRCVLDPGSAPASFSDIPSGCDFSGGGADVSTAGPHVVYAASEDAVGNEETPVSSPFRIGHTLSVTVNAPSGGSSVTSSPGPIACPGTCSADFAEINVTLTATPGPGLVFSGWSGACTGTGTCTVSMIQNQAVTAGFATAPPPPPTNLVGNPGFETSTAGWIPGGTKVTLTRVSGGHSGSWAGQLTNIGKRSLNCTIDDSPNWVTSTSAGTYTASMWILSPRVGATFTLRIREYSGSSKLKTKTVSVTTTGSWQQVTMTYVPRSVGSSLDLNGYMSSAPGPCFTVDDVSITKS